MKQAYEMITNEKLDTSLDYEDKKKHSNYFDPNTTAIDWLLFNKWGFYIGEIGLKAMACIITAGFMLSTDNVFFQTIFGLLFAYFAYKGYLSWKFAEDYYHVTGKRPCMYDLFLKNTNI